MPEKRNSLVFIVATVAMIFVAHHAMVLMHEWTHGTVAWIVGCKDNPFDIHYGDWTLLHVDEAVDYKTLFASDRGSTAAAIAISALLTNSFLFILSLFLLSRQKIQERQWVYQFIFWFGLMNIAELYSYVPLRTFSPSGDVGHFLKGANLSPWLAFFIGTPLVGLGIWRMLKKELSRFCSLVLPSSRPLQRMVYVLVMVILFFYYGMAALFYYGVHDPRSIWSVASFVIGATLIACAFRQERGKT